MSERRLRLLYKTTCAHCGDPVPAGTATWWDDDRRHATCGACMTELEAEGHGPEESTPRAPDVRDRRRREVIRTHRLHPAPRPKPTPTAARRLVLRP